MSRRREIYQAARDRFVATVFANIISQGMTGREAYEWSCLKYGMNEVGAPAAGFKTYDAFKSYLKRNRHRLTPQTPNSDEIRSILDELAVYSTGDAHGHAIGAGQHVETYDTTRQVRNEELEAFVERNFKEIRKDETGKLLRSMLRSYGRLTMGEPRL